MSKSDKIVFKVSADYNASTF